jgi:hypothetical protein
MEKTSRRAALGAFASLPALALLPAAAMAAPADAELFALLGQLEAIVEHRRPFLEASYATGAILDDMMCRRIPRAEIDAWEESSGHAANVDTTYAFDNEADSIVGKMFATPPKTPAGLSAIAKALKLQDIPTYWEEPEDNRDWDKLQVARFVDLVISLGDNRGDA